MSGPVDPEQLIAALVAHGWSVIFRDSGRYARLINTQDRMDHSLLIPLNPTFGDYAPILNGILAELRAKDSAGAQARAVLARLSEAEPPPVRGRFPDLVNATEAGEIIGVSRQRASQLAATDPAFPAGLEVSGVAAWPRAAIEEYAQNRVKRRGGRPRRSS